MTTPDEVVVALLGNTPITIPASEIEGFTPAQMKQLRDGVAQDFPRILADIRERRSCPPWCRRDHGPSGWDDSLSMGLDRYARHCTPQVNFQGRGVNDMHAWLERVDDWTPEEGLTIGPVEIVVNDLINLPLTEAARLSDVISELVRQAAST